MDYQVILLTADYTLLNAITWKRALCLMVKGKADIVELSEHRVGPLIIPRILRLIKRVKTIYRSKVGWSKRSVLLRGRFTCQYCSRQSRGRQLTIDHVLPRSLSGRKTWNNTVAACFACNNRKSDRIPEEAGMHLLRRPYQPTLYDMILCHLEVKSLPEAG